MTVIDRHKLCELLGPLLTECFDALRVPTQDHRHRGTHLRLLRACLQNQEIPADVRSLLQRIETMFQERLTWQTADFMTDFYSEKRALHEESPARILCRETWGLMNDLHVPRYVYHGTIFGRLKSISEQGLVAAKIPVHRGKNVSDYCTEGVFFELTWRGAMSWAELAAAHSRGPRQGPSRRPAVIRIPYDEVRDEMEWDRKATSRDSLMVRKQVVDTRHAEVFLGPFQGYPNWHSLTSVVQAGVEAIKCVP